jgi:hypothetical protein
MYGSGSTYGHQIVMSINRKGYMAVAYGFNSVAVSFNYGATWNNMGYDEPRPNDKYSAMVALSQHNNPSGIGRLFRGENGNQPLSYASMSNDWGLTWTRIATFSTSDWSPMRPFLGYMRPGGVPNVNDANQRIFYVNRQHSRIINPAGTTLKTIGGVQLSIYGAPADFNIFTQDGNYLVATYGPNTSVVVSQDEGTSWIGRGGLGGTFSNTGYSVWPNNKDLWLAYGPNYIWMTLDGGANRINLAGNIVTVKGNAAFRYAEWDISDYIGPS